MRVLRSLGYAARGLYALFREEPNFRIELAVGEVVFFGLWALGFPPTLTALAILMTGLVMAGEAINTAVEKALDTLGERSDRIGKAKDAAAAGVLLLSAAALALGTLLAWPMRQILAHRALSSPEAVGVLFACLALTFLWPRSRHASAGGGSA